ncbi:MAG: NRDE family protein [Desulfobacterales bacterium]|nr:NRDE family protein [Desulfobacterales bacterium]
MCLILIAIQSHSEYKLVIAANRDEFYERPTAPAAFWDSEPGLLAGRDLRAGGTWLGITKKGRIAAITNYRDPSSIKSDAPSRGSLVTDFLSGQQSSVDYLEGIKREAHEYNGFNLIVGEKHELYWYSNRGQGIRDLSTGIYGVSNRILDTPWPKVTRGKKMLRTLLNEEKNPAPEAFFSMLADRSIPDDKNLPDTGVGLEWEKMLSPVFITSPDYGTRSSTLIFINLNDRVTFIEKTFNSSQDHSATVKNELQIPNRNEEYN